MYTGVVPFSKKEYHGETSIGFRPRIDTHKQLGDKRSTTMELYKFMKSAGRSKLIWLPLITWDDSIEVTRPTKSTRLVSEAWEVYQRQSELNNLGKHYGEEKADVFAERMMLGRRKRDRQLLKFRLAPHDDQLLLPTPGKSAPHQRMRPPLTHNASQHHTTPITPAVSSNMRTHSFDGLREGPKCVDYLRWLPLVIRLSRRPWFYTKDLYKLVAVKRLRTLGTRDVSKLVGLAHLTLDTQSRSIFWNNLKLVMRGLQNITIQRVRVKSSALALPTFEKKVLTGLRRWLNQWQKSWGTRRPTCNFGGVQSANSANSF